MKTTILMAVILLSLTFSMNAQEVGAKKYAETYSRYVARMEHASKEVLDYEPWCAKNNYTPYKLIPKSKLLPPSSPGDYLIKSKDLILTGIGLQIASSGILYYAAMNPEETGYDNNTEYKPNVLMYVGIAGVLTGFIYEITGINHIGKAGLAFNKYGVGVHIPIK